MIGTCKKKHNFKEIKLEENVFKMEFKGIIVSGTEEGAYFMSRSVYTDQFEAKLNFKPFMGTLNIQVDEDDVERVKKLLKTDIPMMKGEGIFGDVKFKKAVLNDEIEGAVIFPEKTRHSMDIVEFIAPKNIKETYHLGEGDPVTVKIED